MGKATGFIEIRARSRRRGRSPSASATGSEVYLPYPDDDAARAGRALHGLRHPVLPSGLPARQPDPGLERPGLPRSLAARRSSGCTRPTTSPSSPAGSARRRAKARACSASTTTRSRSSRSSWRSSIARSTRAGSCREPPAIAHRQEGGGRRLRPGRPRRRRAAQPRRPLRSRCSSAPTASAGCCATAFPSSRWRSASSTGGSTCWRPRASSSGPASTSASTCRPTSCAASSTRSCSRGGADRPRDLPMPGRELDGHPLRDGVPDAAEPPLRGRRRSPTSDVHHRGGQARRSSSAAATPAPTASAPSHRQGARVGRTSSSCCRGRPTRAPDNPWPQWPNIFRVSSAHEEGGERALRRRDRAVRRRRRRAASARCTAISVELRRDGRPHRRSSRSPGSEFELRGRPGAAGDGLPRPREQRPARRARRAS